MAGPVIDILMYHSISDGDHPTQISPAAFAVQIAELAETGVPVIGLDDLVAAQDGAFELAKRSVIITFDDAFVDFAEIAWPILSSYKMKSMVYVPTGHVGGSASWEGASTPAIPIMDWSTIKDLADSGVDFGSHTVTHPDLNRLPEAEIIRELTQSSRTLEENLGKPIRHFAPPYGRANAMVKRVIGEIFDTSVGTTLDSARLSASRLDLPRVEMYYFRNKALMRRHLTDQGSLYFTMRKGMRRSRQFLNRVFQRD